MNVSQLFVSSQRTLRECMVTIDQTGKGIALVVEDDGRLIDTVTDGDIRRAILASIDLDMPVAALAGRSGRKRPLTAPAGTPPDRVVELMRDAGVRHLPLLDDRGRVVDLAHLGDIEAGTVVPVTAVVMAGGFGTRLRPLTEETPKSLLPVGDRPLLHLILDQLREAGVRKVRVTTHYKGEQISEYLGNGEAFGLDVRCVPEDRPLGTAGSLGLMEATEGPLLVINGDILTRLDFRHFIAFHREHEAAMTVAVRRYEFQVPYGVIEARGVEVVGISEKPTVGFFVNAGMYLLDPCVVALMTRGEHCDMPDLIRRAVEKELRVINFPLHEYWLDVGQLQDYQTACEDAQAGRLQGNRAQ